MISYIFKFLWLNLILFTPLEKLDVYFEENASLLHMTEFNYTSNFKKCDEECLLAYMNRLNCRIVEFKL